MPALDWEKQFNQVRSQWLFDPRSMEGNNKKRSLQKFQRKQLGRNLGSPLVCAAKRNQQCNWLRKVFQPLACCCDSRVR
jgi:hypothetical protein